MRPMRAVKSRLTTLVAAAAALVCASLVCRPCSSAVADKFVWISDFHWDPDYGTPDAQVHLDGAPCRNADAPKFGAYGCGAPKALVESSIAEAALVSGGDPDFILLTGDMPRHNKGKANLTALPIMQEIRDMIYAAFPNVSNVVLPGVILGNNDMSPNYSVNVTSTTPFEPGSTNLSDDNPYFIELASGLAPNKAFLGENDTESFEHGAYGVREVIPGLKIMQLNTIVYSPSSSCSETDGEDCPEKTEDPFGQFEWMRDELERCREDGCLVYLAAHIPPVLQTFGFGPQLWEDSFVGAYLEIVQEYQDVIAAQLMAHVHSNELRAVPGLDDDSAPMITHTSIAPCYTTNPMVSVVHYDSVSKRPLDFSVYEADLSANSLLPSDDGPLEWSELCSSLLEFLGLESLSNGAVAEWAASLVEDERRWEAWWNRWYKGPRQEECSGVCRQGESCRLSDGFLAADFDSCNTTQHGSAGSTDDDSNSAPGPLLRGGFAGVFMSSAFMLIVALMIDAPSI